MLELRLRSHPGVYDWSTRGKLPKAEGENELRNLHRKRDLEPGRSANTR